MIIIIINYTSSEFFCQLFGVFIIQQY